MSNNNRTNVPTFDSGSASATPDGILARLTAELDSFSPQLKKAAGFILDNPNEVGVSSIREISEAADVTPNTLVRLAKSVGFEGYEELRAPFREQMRTGFVSFTDRVRWLQQVSQHANPSVKKILIGNKCDLVESKVITKEQGETIAHDNNMSFFETSAKSGFNI